MDSSKQGQEPPTIREPLKLELLVDYPRATDQAQEGV